MIYWLPVLLYLGAIFWLSSQPRLPGARYFELHDKITHFLAYFFLTGFVWRAFAHAGGLFRGHPSLWTFLLVITYGASDEFHQRFVPYRMADVKDWAADCLGAALMLAVICIGRQVRR
ncbi:MAG: VanZ family protein [Armatimonadetes bacterium]|nr:VanZ family protein [Armatimonadota bacterium]